MVISMHFFIFFLLPLTASTDPWINQRTDAVPNPNNDDAELGIWNSLFSRELFLLILTLVLLR